MQNSIYFELKKYAKKRASQNFFKVCYLEENFVLKCAFWIICYFSKLCQLIFSNIAVSELCLNVENIFLKGAT